MQFVWWFFFTSSSRNNSNKMKSDTHNHTMGSLAAAIAITVHGSRGLNVFRLRDGNFTFALLFVSSAALNQTMPITCNELHTPQIFTIIAIKENHHSSISFPKKILKPPLWGLFILRIILSSTSSWLNTPPSPHRILYSLLIYFPSHFPQWNPPSSHPLHIEPYTTTTILIFSAITLVPPQNHQVSHLPTIPLTPHQFYSHHTS